MSNTSGSRTLLDFFLEGDCEQFIRELAILKICRALGEDITDIVNYLAIQFSTHIEIQKERGRELALKTEQLKIITSLITEEGEFHTLASLLENFLSPGTTLQNKLTILTNLYGALEQSGTDKELALYNKLARGLAFLSVSLCIMVPGRWAPLPNAVFGAGFGIEKLESIQTADTVADLNRTAAILTPPHPTEKAATVEAKSPTSISDPSTSPSSCRTKKARHPKTRREQRNAAHTIKASCAADADRFPEHTSEPQVPYIQQQVNLEQFDLVPMVMFVPAVWGGTYWRAYTAYPMQAALPEVTSLTHYSCQSHTVYPGKKCKPRGR